jgi:hypothetical protein
VNSGLGLAFTIRRPCVYSAVAQAAAAPCGLDVGSATVFGCHLEIRRLGAMLLRNPRRGTWNGDAKNSYCMARKLFPCIDRRADGRFGWRLPANLEAVGKSTRVTPPPLNSGMAWLGRF